MKVFIANFGRENYEWPECKRRGSVATMNALDAQKYWEAGDREGYISSRIANDRTAAGLIPTKPVASRWFNLMTIVSETAGDLWIHRAGERLWWTISTAQPPEYIRKTEAIARGREVVVCHKPCQPWSDVTKSGIGLMWKSLHPKARDFLSTESTLQQLSPDYADYTIALIEGRDLSPWHDLPLWARKNGRAGSKYSEVRVADEVRRAAYREAADIKECGEFPAGIYRMVATALKTAQSSNGQQVLRNLKNKEVRCSAKQLEDHIVDLFEMQEGICALSELPFDLDERDGDKAFFLSLDRIDSDGHYEIGNLQLVCRFINRWKGADDNEEFRRLMSRLRSGVEA